MKPSGQLGPSWCFLDLVDLAASVPGVADAMLVSCTYIPWRDRAWSHGRAAMPVYAVGLLCPRAGISDASLDTVWSCCCHVLLALQTSGLAHHASAVQISYR